ncbi:hypothetical protein U737_05280 [Methylomonas sp. LW13]|uniref:hypothetical protein n=1 Tax=unclassified Methylomonas TaxID=2608980 RepID=UPI00051C5538|nr:MULTISPECIES: hypothetical protein [unclassified Methylomonas]PKD41030.1 hypothetical protein CWO84_07185 [Methylomonas sp. Kb3]QBC26381.1 hypothetical protein U737_05280 [Methylomonas sp. LW13]
MKPLEPKIYILKVFFKQSDFLQVKRLCSDLGIMPENTNEIGEDDWGHRGYLELWFQEVTDKSITLHIQKQRNKTAKKYMENLQQFFDDLYSLEYVEYLVYLD